MSIIFNLCPQCGGEARPNNSGRFYAISCSMCHATVQIDVEDADSVKRAVADAWNAWAPPPPVFIPSEGESGRASGSERRFQQLATFYAAHVEKQVGRTIIEREEDGSPAWGGRSDMLWLVDVCDELIEARKTIAGLKTPTPADAGRDGRCV